MTAFVITCLSCMYLFIFTPLVLRSISQLQNQRVVFFNFRNGALRARQLTGNAATTFAGTQLVGRIIILGGVLTGVLQGNLNIIILSTLAGMALGAVAMAIGEREAADVESGPGFFFNGNFNIRTNSMPPGSLENDVQVISEVEEISDAPYEKIKNTISDDVTIEDHDIIEDADFRPIDASHDADEKPKNSPPEDQS